MSPPRRLAATVVTLLVCAVLLWSSTRLVWLHGRFHSQLRGTVSLSATGADLKPELAGLALVALAGIAAVVAVSGWPRRLVGALLGLAGGWVVWLSLTWLLGPAPTSLGAVAPPPGSVPEGVPERTPAPVLVLVAGVLLVLIGVATLRWAAGMPGLGRRYAAPAAARRSPDRDTEWWHALDEGEDPTTLGRSTDPGPTA